MTLTYSIDHAPTTTEAVNVEVAEKSGMTLVGTTTDPKTGEVVSTYVLATGDNSFPANVVYRAALQARSTGNIRRISMTFSTWARKSDSVSGTDTVKPLTGTISFNIPADFTVEVADLNNVLGSLMSYMYLSVTASVRDTTWLQKLLYGIPQVK
jgi:hypothetical protein